MKQDTDNDLPLMYWYIFNNLVLNMIVLGTFGKIPWYSDGMTGDT